MTRPDRRARAVPPDWLPPLTQIAAKRDWYGFDPYFRDTCDDLNRLGADGVRPDLLRHSFIVFRPDAVVTRSIERALDVLDDADFEVLDIVEFTYSRLTVREGWRYQLNIATPDRIAAMDLILLATPSLFVLLRETGPQRDVPSALRLSALKGPSAPEARRCGELRAAMGPVQASVLTFVHTPDEPIDLVRELAVFLTPEQRRDMLVGMARRPGAWPRNRIVERVAELYARTPMHDLEFETALARIGESGAAWTAASFRAQLATLRDGDDAIEPLDAVAVYARFGERHTTGLEPVLPDAKPAFWHGSANSLAVPGPPS